MAARTPGERLAFLAGMAEAIDTTGSNGLQGAVDSLRTLCIAEGIAVDDLIEPCIVCGALIEAECTCTSELVE